MPQHHALSPGTSASISLSRLRSNLSKFRQDTTQPGTLWVRFRIAAAEGKIHIAIMPVELFVDRGGLGIGLDRAQGQADRCLRLLNGLVRAGGEQCKDA